MVSNWLKTTVLVLIFVDMWVSYEIWNMIGGSFWGVVLLTFGFFNLCLGMGLSQMAYLTTLRKEMEEDDDEIEVHTFKYTVEKEEKPSSVIHLINSSHGMESELPPVS